MRSILFAPTMFVAVSSIACSGTSPQKPTTVETKSNGSSNAASATESGTFSLAVLDAPQTYAMDGNVSEWGSLLPTVEPSRPAKDQKDAKAEPEKNAVVPVKAPSPRDAESHIAVSFTSKEFVIVGELGESAAQTGVVLGVEFDAPTIAHAGEWGRGGAVWGFECEYEHKDISDGSWVIGARNPPEVIAACKQLEKDHELFEKKNLTRFRRFFRINSQGITMMVDGKPQPVEGAKAIFTPQGKKATIEVSLPFKALPRTGVLPLPSVMLAAQLADADGMVEADAELGNAIYALPKPASFGVDDGLLAAALQADILEPTRPPGLSYQPGDPLHFEAMGYQGDPSTVKPIKKTLFHKIATFGDVEVGHVPDDGFSIATRKAGKFIALSPAETDYNRPVPMTSGGVVERDGELHVFVFQEGYYSASQGPMQAGWSVTAVARDGTLREAVDCNGPYGNWHESFSTISDDKQTLAFRGEVWRYAYEPETNPEAIVEVTYRWDRQTKMYTCKETRLKALKPYPVKGTKAVDTGTNHAQDDIVGLMKRPTNWEGLREITVTGSSALKCVTQTMGPKHGAWFRAYCSGDAVTEVTPISGHRKTQTEIKLAGGKAEVYTPIAEGTEVSFSMKFEKAGARKMTIRWKKGLPTPSGVIEK